MSRPVWKAAIVLIFKTWLQNQSWLLILEPVVEQRQKLWCGPGSLGPDESILELSHPGDPPTLHISLAHTFRAAREMSLSRAQLHYIHKTLSRRQIGKFSGPNMKTVLPVSRKNRWWLTCGTMGHPDIQFFSICNCVPEEGSFREDDSHRRAIIHCLPHKAHIKKKRCLKVSVCNKHSLLVSSLQKKEAIKLCHFLKHQHR